MPGAQPPDDSDDQTQARLGRIEGRRKGSLIGLAANQRLNNSDYLPNSKGACRISTYMPCHCDGYLNDLDLLADSRQHLLIQTVEFIKAAPRPTLDQAHKDASHALEVKLLITIEHKDLP